jgi:hypothetical protein
LIWIRIWTGGETLRTRWWIFEFQRVRGISGPAEKLLITQEEICSFEVLSSEQLSGSHGKPLCKLCWQCGKAHMVRVSFNCVHFQCVWQMSLECDGL